MKNSPAGFTFLRHRFQATIRTQAARRGDSRFQPDWGPDDRHAKNWQPSRHGTPRRDCNRLTAPVALPDGEIESLAADWTDATQKVVHAPEGGAALHAEQLRSQFADYSSKPLDPAIPELQLIMGQGRQEQFDFYRRQRNA